MEIPFAVLNDPTVLARFDDAIHQVSSRAFRALPAWPAAADPAELPIRAALVSVCLDQLVREMQALYRMVRGGGG